MSEPISQSRRKALKQFVLLCGAAGALRAVDTAQAAEAEHVKPTDPTAQALSYHEDAKTVDAKQFPTYQPGQMCNTCLQLQGKAGDPYRPCNIFAGKLVNANGWCKVWVKKA
ncbi:MAG TPA: high-potential iron-sulfur protein [Steroidobacteraceae bacterium]|jgi:hypothetical protein